MYLNYYQHKFVFAKMVLQELIEQRRIEIEITHNYLVATCTISKGNTIPIIYYF